MELLRLGAVISLALALRASPSDAQSAVAAPTPVAIPAVPTIAGLVARLDADPDILHADFTPSVWALCALGLPGASAVLHLLDAPDQMTRLHASRVVTCAVLRHFDPRGLSHSDTNGLAAQAAASRVIAQLGAPDPDAPPASRRAVADAWRRWIALHASDPPPLPDGIDRASLARAIQSARASVDACVHAPGHISVTFTFAGSGALLRAIAGRGRHGTAEGNCIESAVRGVRVDPFARRSQTLAVSFGRP